MMKQMKFLFCLSVSVLVVLATAEPTYPCLKCDACIAADPSVEGKCEQCALGGYGLWPCNDEKLCKCDPNATPKKDCNNAISKDGVTFNSECKQLCIDDAAAFDEKCTIERYAFIDKVRMIDDQCFTTNIYGYEENGLNGAGEYPWAEVGNVIEDVATAQECQESCQRMSTCVYWSWRMKSDGNTKYGEHTCLLKTEDEVTEPFNVPMLPRPNEDTEGWSGHVEVTDELYHWYQFCNLGLRYQCTKGGYECLKCPDLVCAYKSAYHVAGPKFCGLGSDDCKPIPPPATTTPTPTAPASDDSNTNDGTPVCPCGNGCCGGCTPAAPPCKCKRQREAVDVMLLEDNSCNTAELREFQKPVELKKALAEKFRGRVRLGLASFVDKPLPPYGSFLSRDYCYKLHVPLRKYPTLVEEELAALHTFNGGDQPENQLGALIDVANDDSVQWQADKKFVVLVTDEEFHQEGDAANITANAANNTGCLAEDYPSVDRVREVLSEKNIVPIFAVTSDVADVYEDMVTKLGFGKVVVLGEEPFANAVADAASEEF